LRGTIEFSQGAVLYILLMLLVVFIGLMIVTKGQITLIFEQDSLSTMFGPSQFRMTTLDSNGKEKTLSKNNMQVECGSGLNLKIKNVKFTYTGSGKSEFNFIVILDLDARLIIGHTDDGTQLFTCTKQGERASDPYDCGQVRDITFDNVPTGGILHFTAWKDDSAGSLASEITARSGQPDGYTFGDLSDDHSQNYLGSQDLAGATMNEACLGELCKNRKGEENCIFTPGCWFKSSTGICSACKSTNDCSYFKDANECDMCGTYNFINCEWSSNQCRSV